MNKLLFLLMATLSFNSLAADNKNDGYTMLQNLKTCNPNPTYACGLSSGYIMSVGDYMSIMGKICAENVRYGQYIDVVKKFLEENPARQHELHVFLIADAFKQAWPCTTPGTTGKK